MSSDFSRCLSLLRQEKGISQRAAAKDLGISQALLSHYENGVREPGLAFVTKACNYYNVSADFLLGRTLSRDGTTIAAEELYDYSTEKDNVLHGSIMATLNKKLLVNSIGVLFDLLGKTGRKEAITPRRTTWVPLFTRCFATCTGRMAARTRTSSPCPPGSLWRAWPPPT